MRRVTGGSAKRTGSVGSVVCFMSASNERALSTAMAMAAAVWIDTPRCSPHVYASVPTC